ncbi:MAG: tRNA 2-thiouridine(34) synthase MnmA [Candidatus Paceibacterota bacterium]
MTKNTAPRVFVGLSGGVDSSVAALRLKKRGFDVVGVFIKVWHPDFLVCNWEAERLDAMRVAAHLDIPFLTCDAEAAYRDEVAKYFIDEYLAGRTPNPDVMCNKHVKFGAFMDFALEMGADFIATGHYARQVIGDTGPELHRGLDQNKDQSYFLWTLTNEQLSKTMLPIGDTIKDVIRNEAKLAGIPTASKKDSQGICFLGHIDIKDFLSHYTTLVPGKVLDTEGNVVGTHNGALIYTSGQRHGIDITTAEKNRLPYYVVSKDVNKNIVVVSTTKPILEKTSDILLNNLVLRSEVKVGDIFQTQSRYRQIPFTTKVTSVNEDSLTLELMTETETPASGQSCVLYRESCCIGGGIIA